MEWILLAVLADVVIFFVVSIYCIKSKEAELNA